MSRHSCRHFPLDCLQFCRPSSIQMCTIEIRCMFDSPLPLRRMCESSYALFLIFFAHFFVCFCLCFQVRSTDGEFSPNSVSILLDYWWCTLNVCYYSRATTFTLFFDQSLSFENVFFFPSNDSWKNISVFFKLFVSFRLVTVFFLLLFTPLDWFNVSSLKSKEKKKLTIYYLVDSVLSQCFADSSRHRSCVCVCLCFFRWVCFDFFG